MSSMDLWDVNTTLARKAPGVKRRHDYTALLQALADGQLISDAADSLGIPPHTASNILGILRKRYKAINTVQLVAHYLRNGWID